MEAFIVGLFVGAMMMWASLRKKMQAEPTPPIAGNDLLTVTTAFETRLANVERILSKPRGGGQN